MGAGYHGGFGATKGSGKSAKTNYIKGNNINYTREQILSALDGVTEISSRVAERIRKGEILLSVLGDELFDNSFTVKPNTAAFAEDNKIYIRRSSMSLISDVLHEGVHANDYLHGVPAEEIGGWPGELRAYRAEHEFQIKAGLTIEYANDDDICVHVWGNYDRRKKK